ncbi:ECF transporter S component [Clostridium hydrogeniformans]|uniref:ECF transporter S component n=1 Tax=Clostridium hydrogeniformans TaxID=349933 RepID=UPI0005506486|nr:ECF transporter S component [Clostridium hydrogeniformans]
MQGNIAKKSYLTITDIVQIAVMSALICVATMVIHIKTYNGFVHLGDGMVLVSVIILKNKKAVIASALGMGLADILLTYVLWAPFTMVIKAVMALIAILIIKDNKRFNLKYQIIGFSFAVLWMIVAYYFSGAFIKFFFEGIPTFKSALYLSSLDIPGNIIQGLSGIVVAIALSYGLNVSRSFKYRL